MILGVLRIGTVNHDPGGPEHCGREHNPLILHRGHLQDFN
jgi:hypothetical protein